MMRTRALKAHSSGPASVIRRFLTLWERNNHPAESILTPVTCTIIAKNEVDRIARAIESVRGLVDEILIIDSGSTDGTQARVRWRQ